MKSNLQFIAPIIFTIISFNGFSQSLESINSLCDNVEQNLDECENCKQYLHAGYIKSKKGDHVGAIYEYTLAYNAEYSEASKLIYDLINQSATDLEKIKASAEKNAAQLQILNSELELSEQELRKNNEIIIRQKDSISVALEEIYKKGKKAEFLRIPILVDSILQKGKPDEALDLAFYGLTMQVDESYSALWKAFASAAAASDNTSPVTFSSSEPIRDFQTLPAGRTLVSTTKNVYIIGVKGEVDRIPTKSTPPFFTVLSDKKNKLAICGDDGGIEIWELNDFNLITDFKDYDAKAQLCSFSPDENSFVYYKRDEQLFLRNINTNKAIKLADTNSNIQEIRFSQDGSHFLTRYANGTLGLWDNKGQLDKMLGKEEIYLHDAEFSNDGGMVVSSNTVGQVKLWNISKDNPTLLDQSEEAKKNAVFISDNQVLYNSSKDLFIRNIADNKLEKTISFSHKIIDLYLNKDKTYCLVLSTGGSRLHLYNINNNSIIDYYGHNTHLTSIGFSPDQKWIISTDRSGTNILWDLKGNMVLQWTANTVRPVPASFSDKSDYLILATPDGQGIKKMPLPPLYFEKMKSRQKEILDQLKENKKYKLQYVGSN